MPLLSRKAAPKALAAAAITDYEALSISITKPDGCSDSGLTFADVATNNGPRAPFVYGVKPGGPASGKLHDGDRVWCINGKEVKTAKAAATLMRNAKGVVELQVMRPNDMRRALELSLAEEQGGARSEERDMEEALAASLGDEPPSASDSADMDEALTLSLSAAPATGSVVDDDELERALAESLREQSMGDEDEMLRLVRPSDRAFTPSPGLEGGGVSPQPPAGATPKARVGSRRRRRRCRFRATSATPSSSRPLPRAPSC